MSTGGSFLSAYRRSSPPWPSGRQEAGRACPFWEAEGAYFDAGAPHPQGPWLLWSSIPSSNDALNIGGLCELYISGGDLQRLAH